MNNKEYKELLDTVYNDSEKISVKEIMENAGRFIINREKIKNLSRVASLDEIALHTNSFYWGEGDY